MSDSHTVRCSLCKELGHNIRTHYNERNFWGMRIKRSYYTSGQYKINKDEFEKREKARLEKFHREYKERTGRDFISRLKMKAVKQGRKIVVYSYADDAFIDSLEGKSPKPTKIGYRRSIHDKGRYGR